jgi:hypothetical protein
MWTRLLLGALLQAAPQAPEAPAKAPPVGEVHAALPESALYVSLVAPGFVESPELGTSLAQQYGNRALIYGRFDGASLTVTFEPDEPRRTSAQWRDLVGDGERFEVDGVACRRTVQSLGEAGAVVRFDAYPVAAGSVFDVHASSSAAAGQSEAPLTRERFEALVRSIRIQYVRRGKPSDLPQPVREAMDRALRAWPKWRDVLQAEEQRAAARVEAGEPDVDAAFARLFALGQLARFEGAPAAELIVSHEACVRAFDSLREPERAERFAGALALETLGLSRALLGNVAESVAPLERALALATELGHEARAGMAYNLACSHARLGAADPALRHLEIAIAADARYRLLAADDVDFASLASNEHFRTLVRNE